MKRIRDILAFTCFLLTVASPALAQINQPDRSVKENPISIRCVKADLSAFQDCATAPGAGGDGAVLDGVDPAIKATVKDLANSNPLTTQIVDANGDAITSFGGGTQYTEGDTDATITGTAILWEDAGNALTPVNASKPLPVDVKNASIPVTGPLTDTQLRATSVPVDTEFPVAAAAADADSNPTAPAVRSFLHGWNGTGWDRLRATIANGLSVDVTRIQGSVAVTGTFWQATQPISAASLPLPTGAATSALQGGGLPAALGGGGGLKVDGSGTALPISGTVTIGTFPDNEPFNLNQISGAAVSQTNPLPVVFPGTLVSGAITTAMTGTTSTSLVSGTASNYLYITSCSLSNDHASVSTTMLLQDGSAGTTLWKGIVPFGGGSNVSFPVPLKVPTAGNALYAANVTTGSSTYASCNGFRSTVSY